MGKKTKIIYTHTDEAPALATQSFLPIVEAFCSAADIEVETKDISLSGRILAHFPEHLSESQRLEDALSELGALAKTADANIIKLPNISASIPQLTAAIQELQKQGFAVPDYPASPSNEAEEKIKATYGKVLGSAVNPVLREGNSDRRVAAAVKEFAKQNPHSMGKWEASSKSHVAHMDGGDFYGSEQSAVMAGATELTVKHVDASGAEKVLKSGIKMEASEVVDASVMNCKKLRQFFEKQMEEAEKEGVLLSLHMKATMMKVSDPIIFGHAVSVYYKEVFNKYQARFDELGVNPRNGIGDVYDKIQSLPEAEQKEIKDALQNVYNSRPKLAMVDSDKGITNLHVPSDVIIDASMPAAIRASGKMWGPDGALHDTKAMIPDRSYAGVYQETIQFCKMNGAFDVPTMGNVSNVGLMARKAEEYGSHDKTFEIPADGEVVVVNSSGEEIFRHDVEQGDIWRMCQTKMEPIEDWVRLGVKRARATGSPAVFWLDPNRAHDGQLIEIVKKCLSAEGGDPVETHILSPVEAARFTLERIKAGKDTISVTGNVLRDYLTDLFPILELGTSAKMLSIVPLLAGGGLYETGAGGSAPKHVQQFVEENHLRWDSLGEFLALSVSLEDAGEKTSNEKALVLARALNTATSVFLKENKSPSRKVGEIDNRGSHFYLAMYWARALSEQSENQDLKEHFSKLAETLFESEGKIMEELNSVQGKPIDMGGYYRPDLERVSAAMRPSDTFNKALDAIN